MVNGQWKRGEGSEMGGERIGRALGSVRVMTLQIACITLDRRVCANRATLDHIGAFCKIAPRTFKRRV